MIKKSLKILLIFSLAYTFACKKGDDSSIPSLTDETSEAVELIKSANKDLQEIKKLYKSNENSVEDLKIAMKKQETEKVQEIADSAVYAINDGITLGTQAVEKIEKAKSLDIKPEFKEYLELKENSLRKLMEAFELRREIALAFKKGYDPKNTKQRDIILAEFKIKDEKFKQLENEAQEDSKKANKLAKEAAQDDS